MDILRSKLVVFNEHFKREARRAAVEITEELREQIAKEQEFREAEMSEWLKTDHFWRALYDAKDIIGQFTGQKELNRFLDNLWETYRSIVDDPDLNDWFDQFQSFVNEVLERPTSKEEKDRQIDELFNKGRELFQKEKWEDKFNELNFRFMVLIDNIKNDSTSKDFGEKISKFAADFALNRRGYPDINVMENSLAQMKNLLIPLFKQQLEQIKIGRVDYQGETYDAVLEDIGFSGSFLPEQIDIAVRNDFHFDSADPSKDIFQNIVQFRVSNIKPEFKNFKFSYQRKTFPKIEDWGEADLKIAGEGAFIQVTWNLVSVAGEPPVANLDMVKCEIDRLEINVFGEKTHHGVLDKMLLPFFIPTIKSKISSTIEDLLRTRLLELNSQINDFFLSKPIESLKEKANDLLEEGVRKMREQQKSLSAV